jgi:hypothetical protein
MGDPRNLHKLHAAMSLVDKYRCSVRGCSTFGEPGKVID